QHGWHEERFSAIHLLAIKLQRRAVYLDSCQAPAGKAPPAPSPKAPAMFTEIIDKDSIPASRRVECVTAEVLERDILTLSRALLKATVDVTEMFAGQHQLLPLVLKCLELDLVSRCCHNGS